jgi:hypothetical protein
MSVELFQEQRTYSIEYKGNDYSATLISHANGDYTESFVYDSEGNAVQPALAMEVLKYVEDNGGGFLHEQL